jgi:RNA polymerase sigma-70 factor, ECF subfamily
MTHAPTPGTTPKNTPVPPPARPPHPHPSRTAPGPAAAAPSRGGGRSDGRSDGRATRLALAARDGDPEAVELFVRELHRDVWRYVAHLSADTQLADDLAQDTFLRALGSLHRFEGRSSARTWLLSIARRTVVDNLRHTAARPRICGHHDWQSAAEQAQPRGIPGFDDGIALAELLALLPEDRRQAFVLTQLTGLPYASAAAVIGCPVGTVRSRVARARTALTALVRAAETPAAAVESPDGARETDPPAGAETAAPAGPEPVRAALPVPAAEAVTAGAGAASRPPSGAPHRTRPGARVARRPAVAA